MFFHVFSVHIFRIRFKLILDEVHIIRAISDRRYWTPLFVQILILYCILLSFYL